MDIERHRSCIVAARTVFKEADKENFEMNDLSSSLDCQLQKLGQKDTK